MGTITGLTAERMLEIEAQSVHQDPVVVSELIEDVVAGEGAQGSLELGKAYRLDNFTVNRPCRFRLYASSGYRSADADRPRDEDPVGDHGCILELFATAELLTMLLLPMPHGYVSTGFTYYLVTNDDVVDGDITFSLTEHVLEES